MCEKVGFLCAFVRCTIILLIFNALQAHTFKNNCVRLCASVRVCARTHCVRIVCAHMLLNIKAIKARFYQAHTCTQFFQLLRG